VRCRGMRMRNEKFDEYCVKISVIWLRNAGFDCRLRFKKDRTVVRPSAIDGRLWPGIIPCSESAIWIAVQKLVRCRVSAESFRVNVYRLTLQLPLQDGSVRFLLVLRSGSRESERDPDLSARVR
jgi:hypothetical protein